MTEREAFTVVVQTLMACTAEDIAAGVRGISERTAHLQRRALDLYSRAVQERDEARAMLAELEARDHRLQTKLGTYKGCGDPEIDAILFSPDPEFDAWAATLPANHWTRYDRSATRIGWHYGRQMQTVDATTNVRDAGPTPFQGRTTRRD